MQRRRLSQIRGCVVLGLTICTAYVTIRLHKHLFSEQFGVDVSQQIDYAALFAPISGTITNVMNSVGGVETVSSDAGFAADGNPLFGGGVDGDIGNALEQQRSSVAKDRSMLAGYHEVNGNGNNAVEKSGKHVTKNAVTNNVNGDADAVTTKKAGTKDVASDNALADADSSTHPINQDTAKPLNIVLLYADDMRHDSIGIAGTQPIHTPFLDQLSTEGMRFTHNCVTTSICWISRATLHTGEYLSKHQSDLPESPKFYERWNTTFPALMKEKGYHVGHIGKWNFWYFEKVAQTYGYTSMYEGHHWYPDGNEPGGQIHTTERNRRDALEFLRTRPEDKPFMLTVAFFTPHAVDHKKEQYEPQPQSMNLYQNITLSPSFDMEESWKRLPNFFTEQNEGRRRWHLRFDNPQKYDKMLKNYYRLVSEISKASGDIYQELKAQGVLDNTLFIFTTDNGLYHGEHGLAGKWYPHEESLRTPLIVRDPRMPYPYRGTTDDSFTLNVDLYPTLLGAAQIPIPERQKQRNLGRDISDIYLRGGKQTWRQEFFYEHPTHLHKTVIPASSALVRKDFKYFTWPEKQGFYQLFDLKNDPQEENDLAKDPKYFDVLSEIRDAHDQLREYVKKDHGI